MGRGPRWFGLGNMIWGNLGCSAALLLNSATVLQPISHSQAIFAQSERDVLVAVAAD